MSVVSVPMWASRQLGKLAEYATRVTPLFMWAITAASQAGYAMCVVFNPHVGHHDSVASWIRHEHRFKPLWVITVASQAKYAMCFASRRFGFSTFRR